MCYSLMRIGEGSNPAVRSVDQVTNVLQCSTAIIFSEICMVVHEQLTIAMILKLQLATASIHSKHPWAVAKVMVLTLAYCCPSVIENNC